MSSDIDAPNQLLEKSVQEVLSKPLHKKIIKKEGMTFKEVKEFDNLLKEFKCMIRGLLVKGKFNKYSRSYQQLKFFHKGIVRFVFDRDPEFSGCEFNSITKEKIVEKIKLEAGYYHWMTVKLSNGDFIKFPKFRSLSYDKTTQKEMNDFMANVDIYLSRVFKTNAEEILEEYKKRIKPPSHALRQNKGGEMMEKSLYHYREQCGFCFGALIFGTSFDLTEYVPTQLHHMKHNTIVNVKRFGKKFIDGLKNLVLLSAKFHMMYPYLDEKHFEKIVEKKKISRKK